MRETWLQSNRRALSLACVPLLLIAVVGACIAYVAPAESMGPARWIGFTMIALGAIGIALLLASLRRARIAYEAGEAFFDLRSGKPIAVPVEIIEAFFLGQGPAGLPSSVAPHEDTVNLVARLSQRETAWAERPVKSSLGQWKEGYITIRGMWCEPLNYEVIRRLNRRLKEVQQSVRHDGTIAKQNA